MTCSLKYLLKGQIFTDSNGKPLKRIKKISKIELLAFVETGSSFF